MARIAPLYFRNFIFGVEDSLVSTVGLLSGIAIGGVSRETIFLTGVVLILVEAFSMAAGSFLAESSVQEYESGGAVHAGASLFGGAVMFVSYFLAGFIPLLPYVFVPGAMALPTSIALSLLTLFVLGGFSGAITRTSILSRGLRMLLVGGVAILAGMVAGALLSMQGLVA